MIGINSDAFYWVSLSRDGAGFQAENAATFGYRSVAVDPVDLLQPLLHGLLQVIAGLAEPRVAPGDEFFLLALHGSRVAGSWSFPERPHVGTVNLTVEIGQRCIGADRLLHR